MRRLSPLSRSVSRRAADLAGRAARRCARSLASPPSHHVSSCLVYKSVYQLGAGRAVRGSLDYALWRRTDGFTVRRRSPHLRASELGGCAPVGLADGLLFLRGYATVRFSGVADAKLPPVNAVLRDAFDRCWQPLAAAVAVVVAVSPLTSSLMASARRPWSRPSGAYRSCGHG